MNGNDIMAQLDIIRDSIQKPDADRELVMQELYMFLQSIQEEEAIKEVTRHSDFESTCHFFSSAWQNYYYHLELKKSWEIANNSAIARAIMADKEHLSNHSDNEMAFLSTLPRHTHFVNIGCGAFPETLMQAYGKIGFHTLMGIDRRQEAVSLAQKIFFHCVNQSPAQKISFIACEAAQYDYSQAGLIMIANSVRHKADVLNRIAETMAEGAIILLRNAIGLGRLLYEDAFLAGQISRLSVTGSFEATQITRNYILTKI